MVTRLGDLISGVLHFLVIAVSVGVANAGRFLTNQQPNSCVNEFRIKQYVVHEKLYKLDKALCSLIVCSYWFDKCNII